MFYPGVYVKIVFVEYVRFGGGWPVLLVYRGYYV